MRARYTLKQSHPAGQGEPHKRLDEPAGIFYFYIPEAHFSLVDLHLNVTQV